jgi:hypothetical protein
MRDREGEERRGGETIREKKRKTENRGDRQGGAETARKKERKTANRRDRQGGGETARERKTAKRENDREAEESSSSPMELGN